jgi:hypothetical protein
MGSATRVIIMMGALSILPTGSSPTIACDGGSNVPAVGSAPRTPMRLAQMMCFLKGEQISGLNKICYYDCAGSAAAITISSVSLCPLSINR